MSCLKEVELEVLEGGSAGAKGANQHISRRDWKPWKSRCLRSMD